VASLGHVRLQAVVRDTRFAHSCEGIALADASILSTTTSYPYKKIITLNTEQLFNFLFIVISISFVIEVALLQYHIFDVYYKTETF
jgi:hypothetical protein